MDQPLLSVIVPCYNVEKYVDKCLSTIVDQIYSNLEVLLIDDGSSDNTGIYCDRWLERDQRIQVIHKQNEGLAYARKTGIESATADYVTFVDSDDWIDKNMYADMMTALLSTNSDIAQCDLCFVYEDGRIEHRVDKHSNSIKILSRVEGVLLLLKDQTWRISLSTKIYKKSLFEHVVFPKGRMWGEDYINHDLFHHAAQSVYIDGTYYFYYQRNDSITKPGDIQKELKKMSDCSDAYYDRYSLVNYCPEYHSALPQIKKMAIDWGMKVLRDMVRYPQYFSTAYFNFKAKQMSSISLTKEDQVSYNVKIELFVIKINPQLYKILRRLFCIVRFCK